MEETSPREAAMKKVLEEHPDLASATDTAMLSRLNELVDSYERDIITQRELEALRRKEFAEQARLQGEEARQQREEATRLAAEEDRALRRAAEQERAQRLEQERAQRLAEAGAVRRFAMTHPVVLGLGVLLVLGVAAGAVIATVQMSANNSARAAAEAEAARVAQEKAAQEEQDRQEAERQSQLEAACDPSLPESELTPQIWMAWLACEDEAVAVEAIRRYNSAPFDAATLERVAGAISRPEVAEFVSNRGSTTMRAHELLVSKWGPETVGPSYVAVYGQLCGPTRPENDVAGTTWKASSGALLTFIDVVVFGENCEVDVDWPVDEFVYMTWRHVDDLVVLDVSVDDQWVYERVGNELRLARVSSEDGRPQAPKVFTQVP